MGNSISKANEDLQMGSPYVNRYTWAHTDVSINPGGSTYSDLQTEAGDLGSSTDSDRSKDSAFAFVSDEQTHTKKPVSDGSGQFGEDLGGSNNSTSSQGSNNSTSTQGSNNSTSTQGSNNSTSSQGSNNSTSTQSSDGYEKVIWPHQRCGGIPECLPSRPKEETKKMCVKLPRDCKLLITIVGVMLVVAVVSGVIYLVLTQSQAKPDLRKETVITTDLNRHLEGEIIVSGEAFNRSDTATVTTPDGKIFPVNFNVGRKKRSIQADDEWSIENSKLYGENVTVKIRGPKATCISDGLHSIEWKMENTVLEVNTFEIRITCSSSKKGSVARLGSSINVFTCFYNSSCCKSDLKVDTQIDTDMSCTHTYNPSTGFTHQCSVRTGEAVLTCKAMSDGVSDLYTTIPMSVCDSIPCKHGNCLINNDKNPLCVCHLGYEGNSCDTAALDGDCGDGVGCTPNAECGKGGHCQCKPGFSKSDINEKYCVEDMDYCSSSPCLHGTCMNTKQGFTCTCDSGYSGPLCDISVVQDCKDDVDCSLNAECGADGKCHCKPGFNQSEINGNDCVQVCLDTCDDSSTDAYRLTGNACGTKFVRCVDGKRHVENCNKGDVFDPSQDVCVCVPASNAWWCNGAFSSVEELSICDRGCNK